MDVESVAFSCGKEMGHFCFSGAECTQAAFIFLPVGTLGFLPGAHCSCSQKEHGRTPQTLSGDPKHSLSGRHLLPGRQIFGGSCA